MIAQSTESGQAFRRFSQMLLTVIGIFSAALAWPSLASPPPFPDQMKFPNVIPPKKQFGQYGSKPGELNEPLGVAVSDEREIFIADTFNHRINVYDSEGTYLRSWGGLGSNPENLKQPQGVAVSNGRVFVSDTGNDRIQVFDTSGRPLSRWGTSGAGLGELNNPLGLAVDSQRVYVVDSANERVQVFSLDGTFELAIGKFGKQKGEFDRPSDVAVDQEGNIYVVDSYNNRIQKFDRDGKVIQEWGEWGSYSGMLASPAGISYARNRLYVSDLINHRIQVFDTAGKYLFQWGRHPITGHEGQGRLHYPHKIAVSQTEDFSVVCEPFEYRCQIFDTVVDAAAIHQVDDTAWWEKNGRFHYGTGIIIIRPTGGGTCETNPSACQAIVAVAEPDTHSVLTFLNSGDKPQFLARLGGQGRTLGSFVRPSGMSGDYDTGRITISDGGNHRLQVFQLERTGPDPGSFAPNMSRALSATSVISVGIDKLSPQGFDGSEKSPVEPASLARDKDGFLYMSDPHNARIVVLDKDLNFVRSFGRRGSGDGELSVPNNISFSRDGEILFVVDTYNFRIVAFRRTGEHLFHWGEPGARDGQFIHPWGITSGQDGFIYVTDDAANRVQKFDERGNHIQTWGRWGTEPGQFYKPKGIAQDERGRLFIADFGNHRAQIMSTDGNYIGMFGIGDGYTPPLSAITDVNSIAKGPRGVADISNGGNYTVTYQLESGDNRLRLNEPFTMLVRVIRTGSNAPANDVDLSVSATMPAHFHGMTVEPSVTKISDGTWRVDGMLLHMPGAWQINFDLARSGTTERAQSDVLVQ